MEESPPPPLSPADGDDPQHSTKSHPSENYLIDGGESISAVKIDKKKKKRRRRRKLLSGYASDAASSSTMPFQRGVCVGIRNRNPRAGVGSGRREGDVEALALPLGMSIAAVVAQVLERKESIGGGMVIDQLSQICTLAVREALANVFGDKFDTFASNFEKSFRSTLMTLRLINETSQCSRKHDVHSNSEISHENAIPPISVSTEPCSPSWSKEHPSIFEEKISDQNVHSDVVMGPRDRHDGEKIFQLACVSRCTTLSRDNGSALSTFEKSVMEQTRANDLKAFEIGLSMKKLQLKQKQIDLNCDLNFLERWKLSMGISKASFKADKFKYEVEETRHAELLRKCIDSLVASLFIMLASVAYGTYVFAHNRITEATASCMPFKFQESKSWWMPKAMTSLNSGMHFLLCQVQVLSRMLFGVLLILAIAYLLLQRSTVSSRTMPVTFILLLSFACGFAGKLCIDTLGGNGYLWLLYWELLCILHFLSFIFSSFLFLVLYGPITVTQVVKEKTRFPFWLRRVLFHMIMLVLLPLLCGLMPFGSPSEWKNHFKLRVIHYSQASE